MMDRDGARVVGYTAMARRLCRPSFSHGKAVRGQFEGSRRQFGGSAEAVLRQFWQVTYVDDQTAVGALLRRRRDA